MKERICAIIVTYNTGQGIYKCLNSIIPQVEKVIIVDNGSLPETINILKNIENQFPKVELIKNSQNLGIAAALNRGVELAISKGYDWVLTLDDDSEAEADMVSKLLSAYQTFSQKEKIGIVAPNYSIIKGLVYKEKETFIIPTAITSGQLVKTNVFEKIGFYKEDFFIECVDHEFCLRAKKRGFKTFLVPQAVLRQQIGMPKVYNLFFKKIVVANHLPLRYYYIFRNSVYLYKNYFITAAGWILKNVFSNLVLIVKILFFENKKTEKLLMVGRGCFDGLKNKYGKLI